LTLTLSWADTLRVLHPSTGFVMGQGADPGTVDFPIAYVKRTIPEEQDDLRAQRDTLPDADLFMRDRASPSSVERNITDRITGDEPYDIKDVDVSPDGRRIVFAMRGPLDDNQDEEEAPSRRCAPTCPPCLASWLHKQSVNSKSRSVPSKARRIP
jgi:hypothetical protein